MIVVVSRPNIFAMNDATSLFFVELMQSSLALEFPIRHEGPSPLPIQSLLFSCCRGSIRILWMGTSCRFRQNQSVRDTRNLIDDPEPGSGLLFLRSCIRKSHANPLFSLQ